MGPTKSTSKAKATTYIDATVDVGGDTIEEALDRVVAVRAFPGIGRTSTAFADLADAIRPQQS